MQSASLYSVQHPSVSAGDTLVSDTRKLVVDPPNSDNCFPSHTITTFPGSSGHVGQVRSGHVTFEVTF
jgi:hypothetical protein